MNKVAFSLALGVAILGVCTMIAIDRLTAAVNSNKDLTNQMLKKLAVETGNTPVDETAVNALADTVEAQNKKLSDALNTVPDLTQNLTGTAA